MTGYSIEDPVPGWCSSREGVWPRPGVTLDHGHDTLGNKIRLNFSLAATDNYKDCTNRNEVQYQVYHKYLEEWTSDTIDESLFDSLRKFEDIDNIVRYGTKVSSLGPHIDRLVFAAYPPVGAVFAVVATSANGSSLYGLGHSYGCDLDPITGQCPQSEAVTLIQIFSACSLFAGLILAFAGHKFFVGSQIIFGFYAGVYIGYILLNVFSSLNYHFLFFLVLACGVCISVMVTCIWIIFGIPVISVLLPTLELGVILSSIVLYLPQTNTMSLTSDIHYWLVFTCLVFAAPICLLAFTHKAHILSCVIVGTTLTILPVDFYLDTGLRYMFLNVIRRSYIDHYNEAILVPLFQTGDLVVLACWFVLAALALLCQLLVQRKKPPFPPSPFQQWKWRREANRDIDDDESEPLLVGDQYQDDQRPYEARQAVVGFIETRARRERSEVQRKPRDVFKPSAPEEE